MSVQDPVHTPGYTKHQTPHHHQTNETKSLHNLAVEEAAAPPLHLLQTLHQKLPNTPQNPRQRGGKIRLDRAMFKMIKNLVGSNHNRNFRRCIYTFYTF